MNPIQTRVFHTAFVEELQKLASDSGYRYVETPRDERRRREVARNTPAGETAILGGLGGGALGTVAGTAIAADTLDDGLRGAEKTKGLIARKLGKGALIGLGVGGAAGAGLSLLNRAILRSKISRNWDDRYDNAEKSINARQGRGMGKEAGFADAMKGLKTRVRAARVDMFKNNLKYTAGQAKPTPERSFQKFKRVSSPMDAP